MTLEEVYHILETEKFNKYFNQTTLYNKVMLINLRKSFSEYFFIPEDELYKNNTTGLFFVSLIHNKKNLDIEEVKMDIYNKIPDLTLSVKYLESPEVIKEIKDNMYNDIKILKNKLYTINDLSTIFNIAGPTVYANKFLSRIAIKYNTSIFWIGDVIFKNLNKISQQTISCLSVNKNIVPLIELSKILYPNNHAVTLCRIKTNKKIFGVDLSYVIEEKDKQLKAYFIKNSDYKKILENRKYYIKTDVLRKEYDILAPYEKAAIKNYHDFIFNKQTCLNSVYIKKETVSNIIEVLNLYKNNYIGFIDKLYNHIYNTKVNFYNLFFIRSLIPVLSYKHKRYFINKISTICKAKIVNDTISKKDILKLLEYLKSVDDNYKKQRETNK